MVDEIIWKTIERPGQSGSQKGELITKWNSLYGKDNWRKAWIYKGKIINQIEVFKLCEEAYYKDSFDREEVWEKLIETAKDVYDMIPEEIESGTDYTKQGKYTRFHDICIRNVLKRRGWQFKGDKLIQIRYDKDKRTYFSDNLDPGKVKFHETNKILEPHLKDWWDYNSIEDFYQSNKILQVKKDILDKL